MKKILNKSIYILLIILFFSVPLINSHLLDIFGIKLGFYVNGNYEFTKVIFFNIISSIILFLYGLKIINKKEKIKLPKNIIIFLLFLIISTFFSVSFFTSLFGNSEKGHSLIMFMNLMGVFIILLNTKKVILKKLIIVGIISGIITSIIGIWQLYFPSFDYGDLSNRLVSTSGHPNYISLYFLLIIPFIFPSNKEIKINKKLQGVLLLIILLGLVLTKSFIAITLTLSYFFFIFFNKQKYKIHIFLSIFILGIIGVIYFFPEKLSSLFSRFFIWESTIKIILSDFKIFFLGGGAETFSYIFDNYKSEYLYIFEKIGFTADRPHNIILNFFYHYGILGLIFIVSIYKKIITNFINKKTPVNISLFLGSIFLLFNFPSITSYLIIILLFSLTKFKSIKIKSTHISIICILLPFISLYYSTKFYISETYAYSDNYELAIKTFPYNSYNYYKLGDYNSGLKVEKIESEKYYLTKIYSLKNPEKDCEELIKKFYGVENHFFCGNFLREIGKYSTARKYYKIGLKKLPNLWNNDSLYYNNIIIKNIISGNRFFSEKYSNINQILERVK